MWVVSLQLISGDTFISPRPTKALHGPLKTTRTVESELNEQSIFCSVSPEKTRELSFIQPWEPARCFWSHWTIIKRNTKIMTLIFYRTWGWCRRHVQCTWRAIYVQAVFLLRIVQWSRLGAVVHWSSFWLSFECTTQKYFEQAWSAKWENKPIARVNCNSALRTHLISCRVDYTCSRPAPFQLKTCLRSSVRDISIVGMSVGTFSRGPFDEGRTSAIIQLCQMSLKKPKCSWWA
jgi:hypothetical protein